MNLDPTHDYLPVPTLEDAHRRAPAPPWTTVAPPRPSISGGLAGTLQGFLWAAGALAALTSIMAMASLDAFADVRSSESSSIGVRERLEQEWLDLDDSVRGTSGLFMVVWIVVVVLLLIWMRKVHAVSQSLWPHRRAWGQGWTVGGWFIPLANLVIPKKVLDEVEQIVTAPRVGGLARRELARRPSSIGWVWWLMLVAGAISSLFAKSLRSNGADATPSEIRALYWVSLMSGASWAVSCVFGVTYVRRVTRAANR